MTTPRTALGQSFGETAGCYLCGSAVRTKRVGVNDIDVCERCGMGIIGQCAASDDYWTRQDSTELLEEVYWRARRTLFESALRRLEGHQVKGRALDLGGGVGHFTELALARGWDAYSVDSSELAVRAAAQRLGEDRSLSTGSLADFAESCDLVTLWCVVAHVADPLALVEEALRLLKPGGRLLITTPNFLFQSVYARALAVVGRPIDFVAHDHLLHFTPAALDGLLKKAGCATWSYQYLGVTEEFLAKRSLGRIMVPLKKAWNWGGHKAAAVGLPPLCAELQVIAVKRRATLAPGQSPAT